MAVAVCTAAGSDATNFMQNMECAHTEAIGGLFGADGADVRLHSGFWAGWKTLEKDVTAAVLSFVKEVRMFEAACVEEEGCLCDACRPHSHKVLTTGLTTSLEH